MSKTKTPTIKSTSVPSAYDTPLTTLEYLRKVEEQNAQVLARADEIENSLDGLHSEIAGVSNSKVSKSGDTMTGALNVPQVNATTGVFRAFNAVSQNENTHVEVSNGGFVAEVTEETAGNKKYGVIAYPNGKVGFYVHDSAHNKDVSFIIPNMDDYKAGTYELATKNDIPSGGSSLLEDIEDADGHKRFQKIAGEVASRFTNEYTYLIINGNSITLVGYAKCNANTGYQGVVFTYSLPEWVSLLIKPVTGGQIIRANMTNTGSGATVGVDVNKTNDNKITVSTYTSYAFTSDTFYRFELTLGL